MSPPAFRLAWMNGLVATAAVPSPFLGELLAGSLRSYPFTWSCLTAWLVVSLALRFLGERDAVARPRRGGTDLGDLRVLLCVWGFESILRLVGLLEVSCGPGSARSPLSFFVDRLLAVSAAVLVLVAVLALWAAARWAAGSGAVTAPPLAWLSCLVIPVVVLVDWLMVLLSLDLDHLARAMSTG